MNVLLLEDEAELSAVACEQLELCGYTVFPAFTLAEARKILEADESAIDILIADHQISDGYGARFAIETKGLPQNIRIVVVSGRLGLQEIEELEAHGIAYFNKPLHYAEIVDELVRLHL